MRTALLALLLTPAAAALPAAAQGLRDPDAAVRSRASMNLADPRAQNLARLLSPISINFENASVGDIIRFLREASGADLEPMLLEDSGDTGLDPEMELTFNVPRGTFLTVIERMLEAVETRTNEPRGYAWQFSPDGPIQFGPKERLNDFRRTEIYDVRDLLIPEPVFDEPPEFDLGGEGGGGSGGGAANPFGGGSGGGRGANGDARPTTDEMLDDLIDLIRNNVEREQWIENGGEGGSIDRFRGALIIDAPDYMHRALSGYDWWPAHLQSARVVDGQAQRRFRPLAYERRTRYGTIGDAPDEATAGTAGASGESAAD